MDKLQWGSKKRLRCIKVEDDDDKNGGFMKRSKIKSRVYRRAVERDNNNQSFPTSISLRDLGINRSSSMENQKIVSTSSSPDKEDRYYTTRGSVGGLGVESAKLCMEVKEDKNNTKQKIVWPKLYISLSSKEKEEDFMAMKGCKLPQRPKKRAKLVQRTLLLVSPGAWLSDLCQERYEVREKKASKKRPRGLKAMGGMESDSE